MYIFQGPNLTVHVDDWTELQQKASSPKGDITCSPGQVLPGEGAEVLLSPGGRRYIHDQGVLLLSGIVFLGHSERGRCFCGALLDLALSALGILALGSRCLVPAVEQVIWAARSIVWRRPLVWIVAGVVRVLPVLCFGLFSDAW